MARLNIQSERVQGLIADKVIPLFLVAGSIASLTKTLNDALREAGIDGILHPNRLHSLLSNDVGRGLNEATIELAEQAASLALVSDSTIPVRAAQAFQVLLAEARRLQLFTAAAPEQLAHRLSIPPALAERLLQGESNLGVAATPLNHKGAEELVECLPESPDWSYQDIAVSRCLEAFGRRPGGRIGLILPTGAGKTRTALRIVLAMLNKSVDVKSSAYWVTHRRNLREQALRELQKLVSDGTEQMPADRHLELANRIKFVMVGDLASVLESATVKPVLIVVDEAHHAAAPSYQPVFANPWTAPVLLLTATPNRGDQLPIGIDEIAFTITYRELAQRRAILPPTFLDFPVDDFDWSDAAVADLVDYVLDRSSAEFTKALVLAPRVDRVEEFYRALLDRLPPDHPLEAEDIGYVHGTGNSLGFANEDFLARFASKPRAILISAQLLLEGFDDPSINAVVLTYPSTSIIRLMQAAGRCVRYAPGKRRAYVVQARNDSIAYHFDQRWLYQEIDDYLRPQLQEIEYGSLRDLRERVVDLLRLHNVDQAVSERVLNRLEAMVPGEACNLFLYGIPYFGTEEDFYTKARWSVALESSDSSVMLRSVFNSFCANGADLSDPSDFLIREGAAHGVKKDLTGGSRWMEMMGLLTASYFAKREVHGPSAIQSSGSRPYRANGATTWLKYITCSFRPAVPSALAEFLRDCHNSTQVEADYLDDPARHDVAVKVPLPLGGAEGFLLDRASREELDAATAALRELLANAKPREQFSVLAGFIAGSNHRFLPNRLLSRAEFLLTWPDRNARILHFNKPTHHEEKEVDHV